MQLRSSVGPTLRKRLQARTRLGEARKSYVRNRERAAFAARFFPFARSLELLADNAQQRVYRTTDEHESKNGENGNDRDDESVLRETLSFLAVKDQEHVASFRKRRLAFVATFGWTTCAGHSGPDGPSVASGYAHGNGARTALWYCHQRQGAEERLKRGGLARGPRAALQEPRAA